MPAAVEFAQAPRPPARRALRRTLSGPILIAAVVALATLPRALINYGPDENGPNSAHGALTFAQTGVYRSMRYPGNPLFDYFLTLVAPWGGHVAANLLVLAFYILAVAGFAYLVRREPARLLLIGTFALTPILLVNAVATIDYVPGLAALLWCYACLKDKRYLLAGLLLGAAIGFRMPHALFLLSAVLYLWMRRAPRRAILTVTGVSLGAGLLCFLPILLQIGLRLFAIPSSPLDGAGYAVLVAYNGLMLWGLLPTVALLVLLAMHRKQVAASVRTAWRRADPDFALQASFIGLLLALFVRHADQTAYLLPVVPFTYLLLARWLAPRAWLVLGALIVLMGLVTVDLKGGTSGRRALAPQVAWGPVVIDYTERAKIARLNHDVCSFDLAPKAVLITGLGQSLTIDNPAAVRVAYTDLDPALNPAGISEAGYIFRCADRPVYLVYSMSESNVGRLRADGYAVYIFSEYAPSLVINEYNYDPLAAGVLPLDIERPDVFHVSAR